MAIAREPGKELPAPRAANEEAALPADAPSILPADWNPIDLASALRLAGVENPEILIARQRVVEASALQMFAAAQVLPNINVGFNFDHHTGVLQQASGNILQVNRDALNVGLGADAIGAGTVNIPGVFYNVNVSQAIFGWLVTRQVVRRREFESRAVRNEVLLRVATGYVELLRAEGLRAIAIKNREEAREVARLTASNARIGQGKQSDADRAATELGRRNELVLAAEGQVLTAAARLAQLLNLDPSLPLHATDGWVVPAPIVPNPVPLGELLYIASQQRPELAAHRVAIREAALALHGARMLPFSPTLLAGFSTDEFGGGSNLVAQPGGYDGLTGSRLGSFAQRTDTDVVLFWTAQNMGLGNCTRSGWHAASCGLRTWNCSGCSTRCVPRWPQPTPAPTPATPRSTSPSGLSVPASAAFTEDMARVRGTPKALPIELLESFRLLSNAREQYLNAISDYNAAQFELYVALGQPPAAALARPIPARLVPPPSSAQDRRTLPLHPRGLRLPKSWRLRKSGSDATTLARRSREGMERPRKSIWKLGCRIGWKAAGVTLLALVGGSGGCESFREDTPPSLESGPVPRAAAPPAGSPVAADEKATVEGAEEQHAEPGQAGTYKVQRPLAGPTDGLETPAIPAPSGVRSICLPDVLALAGVENPVILLAEQAVQSSLALQMQARVLLLPNLNVGGDFNNHTGPLQTSAGYIRSVDRQSAYLGLGAEAVGGGTVAYPGVWLFAPLGNAYFEPKVASLVVAQRSFEAVATRHNVLLDVAVRYLRLLGAEGRLAVVRQTQADFAEVVRLTQANVDVGLAHPSRCRAGADRCPAAGERRAAVQEEVAVAAADLARLLNLDPSTRLQIAKDPILVVQLIDSHQPLAELLEVARSRRPEMQAVAAEIAAAAARVTQEKTRPFLPTLSVGYSEGGFGGGSNLTSPAFNNLHPRGDFDAMAWWTFQNLGFGNAALVKQRRRAGRSGGPSRSPGQPD